MLFTEIDRWIGKTLFVPLIIRFCQLTRQTQFAAARLFWFIAALDGFYRADTMAGSILWGGVSVIMMLTAARRADQPTSSFRFFRLLAAGAFVIDIIQGVAIGAWTGGEFWILVLLAEYAATIRTLPPQQKEFRSAKTAQADRS